MRTLYHEFESLEHLIASRLLPGGSDRPIRAVVFGGTGAVGGATVLELCDLVLASMRLRPSPLSAEIWATGVSDKEIAKFASRVYLALGEEHTIEKLEPRRHYRIAGRIDLRFSILTLELPTDLIDTTRERLAARDDLESALGEYFDGLGCPFLRFVEGLGDELLHAVAVAIPLPSVATYTLDKIDRLVEEQGVDHRTENRIKTRYLRTFIRGLAVIQQRHARHVVMAHTTAVGGMYRVDGGAPEIRLGFAHSARGKKLVDKKFFADELTQLYIDHGFDVLVTAAAIGIDAVDFRCPLPLDRAAREAMRRVVARHDPPPVPPADLDTPSILLYPSLAVDLDPVPAAEGEDAMATPPPLVFGPGKELVVDAAIRSGENGLFSVANCTALYNVMKVAIPEELAKVLVRHAVFGPERRREWFRDKVAYYTETENSYFALRLLEAYPQLVRSHLGAFAVQAYQALGSSTHQARLHELGLVILLLRLLDLGRGFAELPEKVLEEAIGDLDGFLWRATRLPAFEDLARHDAAALSRGLAALIEVEGNEDLGLLLGYDMRRRGVRQPEHERFLARAATRVRRYVQTITSLGIPILTPGTDGRERVLVGPWVAPLEIAVALPGDLEAAWQRLASASGAPLLAARDWTIVNNGFIDLRPHALVTSAAEPGPRLGEQVHRFTSGDDLLGWVASLPAASYFTTAGTLALEVRLGRLFATVRRRKLQLGTHETWKHLFQQDGEGRHVLSPGLVETHRMYAEGLGKVTGTESLWPAWGY